METLQISKANAVKAYNSANEETKKLLAALFGEATLSGKITDRVKTFEDACEVLGLNAEEYQDALDGLQDLYECDGIEAFTKLCVIAKALNEGWQPDWSNSSQPKYHPWFNAGSGLSFNDYGYVASTTTVGSRLCFKSAELAKYFGMQFLDLYKSFFNIK